MGTHVDKLNSPECIHSSVLNIRSVNHKKSHEVLDRPQYQWILNIGLPSRFDIHYLKSSANRPMSCQCSQLLNSLLMRGHGQHHGRTRIMVGAPPISDRVGSAHCVRRLTLYNSETIEGIVHICASMEN